MTLYDPIYIFLLFVVVALIFIGLFLHIIFAYKFNVIGYFFIICATGIFLLIVKYMFDSGIYADEQSSLLLGIGFLELTLLAFPYIFLVLALQIGRKQKRQSETS
ncbi:hypothetical protein ACFVR1_14110 [Psychrobacillus sp. NPDC058041]|uniref:hypothetical protein n=1 Tax=Psychrobacillus sp. NPDC058041 TaxID=3346310 RepID=UPI0036DC9A55